MIKAIKPDIERQFGEAAGEIQKIITSIAECGENIQGMRAESLESEKRIIEAIASQREQEISEL